MIEQRRTLQISIPRFEWKYLFSLPALAIGVCLLACAGGVYWWKAVRPYYVAERAVLQVPMLQIYTTQSGILESYPFEEGGRFLQGQYLLCQNNEVWSAEMREIDQDISIYKQQIHEEKERLDQCMQRYIQAQFDPEVDSILAQVQNAQQNGVELERELTMLQNEKLAIEKKMEPLFYAAPFDGIVLRHLKQKGELIGPGEAVLQVCNAKERWIEAEVPELLLGSLQVGAPATVEFPSFPGRKWSGSVSWISPLVEEGKVRVKLQAENLPLHPGLSAKTSIRIY